jgi:hypothetical protein
MSLKLEIKGVASTIKALQEMQTKIQRSAEGALYLEAWNVMTEAKQRAPLDEGILRNSGYVTLPENGTVELGFGGSASAYALIQHEDLSLHHEVGEAKFLEKASLNANHERVRDLFLERLKNGGKFPGRRGPTEPR